MIHTSLATSSARLLSPQPLTEQVLELLPRHGDNSPGDEAEGRLALHHLVASQAEKTPDAIALVHQGRSLTYEVLNQRANQLAHYLIELGVERDQLIAISLVRSPEMVIAFLGVLKAGAAYVPIDPSYPELRRQYILADAQAEIMVTQADLVATLGGTDCKRADTAPNADLAKSDSVEGESHIARKPFQLICLDTEAATLYQQPKHNPDIAVSPEQLAYVIYTSGSTGNPKGVMAHHLGLVNYSLALAKTLMLTAADRMLQFSTMSFDFIVSEIYPTLATGGALVLRSDEMATSTKAFVDFIAKEKVSVIQFTTAFWHELVSGIARSEITLPQSLRLVLFGGEKASLSLCKQWVEKVGDYPRLFNAYGPTEATVITTLYDAVAEGYDGAEDLPIGRAIFNAQTYVLNEALKPVKPGESGELYIGGPGVTNGYLNLPEKTAQAFVDSPFHKGERLYKTGDLVRMDEGGLIRFVGRVDFQVKIRGFRIELGEIESCLDQYPQIEHRIVVAREDTPGDKRLVAYVVARHGQAGGQQGEQALDRADLKAFLRSQLPAFMMPSAIVELPELPKNANGKIDRKALPMPTQSDTKKTLIAPRTPLEEKLVPIWQSVLGVDTVGITDDFFELGGHSLLVMRLFSELEAMFEARLPLVEIFAAPTIEQMAERLGKIITTPSEPQYIGKSSESSRLIPLRVGEITPPLFLIHDVNGDTGLYIHLARRMGGEGNVSPTENRTIYAIGPNSTDSNPFVQSRIPDMAKDYINQMREVQPQGPYLIGGLCAGGVIAFEAALQLEAMGEEVRLCLLDSPAPDLENREGAVGEMRKDRLSQVLASKDIPKIVSQMWQKGTNVVRYEVTTRAQETISGARAHALRLCQDRKWSLPKMFQGLSTRDIITFAFNTYCPERQLAGPMLLICPTGGDGTETDIPYVELCGNPLLGWETHVQQEIRTHSAPGGHSTMLSDAYVQSLANAIEAFIEDTAT